MIFHRSQTFILSEDVEKLILTNKKVYYDYFVKHEVEAGIVLRGPEVKSIRQHRVHLKESYVHVDRMGNVEVVGMHVHSYQPASRFNGDPGRARRLLLGKREIRKLKQASDQKGMTLIPLRLYLKGQWVKLLIGICQGKKQYDKRQVIKDRQDKRLMGQVMKRRV